MFTKSKTIAFYLLNLLILFSILIAGCASPTTAPQTEIPKGKPYEGVTLSIAATTGGSGAWIAEYSDKWAEQTGAEVNVIQFPYADQFQKIMASAAAGVEAFDLLEYPSLWAGDIMGGGLVKEVPQEVMDKLDWEDIAPAYRERLLKWGDVVYAFPLDGDNHMVYYRKDILTDPNIQSGFKEEYGYELPVPPKTWDQYYDIASFLNDKDWDGDGEPNYGVAEAQVRKQQSTWTYISHATAYAKHPDDPGFFFDTETMEPRINNPGFVQALEDYIKSTSLGPPGMLNYSLGEVRSDFLSGKTVFAIDWADTGTQSKDPSQSVVKGLVGFTPVLGANKVFNAKTDQWEEKLNFASYLAFSGWILSVSSGTKYPEAAFDLATFLTNKENSLIAVTSEGSGINPSRISHFENIDAWVKAGFDEESAKEYLGAIRESYQDPNAVQDLRIPGQAEYFDILDTEIARALAGEISPQEALDNIAREWNAITDRLGRESQLKLYRESLGLSN